MRIMGHRTFSTGFLSALILIGFVSCNSSIDVDINEFSKAVKLKLSSSIPNLKVGESQTAVFDFLNEKGQISTNYTGKVTLTISNDPSGRNAVFLSTGTKTMESMAVNGVLNFENIMIDQPGSGYSLEVSAANLPTIFTNSFDVSGTTKVYRSVGFNSIAPIQNAGLIELTITEKRAEFSSDIADNIGVGDIIQYDSDNDNLVDAIAFIQRRISPREFVLHSPDYSIPPATLNDLDWSICRASISLSDAEDLIENTVCLDDNLLSKDLDSDNGGRDIASANEQWNIAFYGDAPHTSPVISEDGWLTSNESYLRFFTPDKTFEVGLSQRHSGVWDPSKAHMDINNYFGAFYDLRQRHYRIEGFQIINNYMAGASSHGGGMRIYPGLVYSDAGEIHILDNIIRKATGVDNSASVGLRVLGSTAGTKVVVANNIIYGFKVGFIRSSTSHRLHVVLYNNTVGDFSENGYVLGRYGDDMSYKVKNNIVENLNNTGVDWTYSYLAGPNDVYEFNHSTDGTTIGTNDQIGDIDFVNANNNDYRLQGSDVIARDTGIDLTQDLDFEIKRDIKGQDISNIFHMGAHAGQN